MIIECPECGHEVSDKAEKCPKCGYPINQQSSAPSPDNKNKKWLWIAVAAVAVVILGIGAWSLLKSDIFNDDDPNAIVELTPEFIEKVQQYDQLAPFSEGRAAVRRGSLWGYIDTKGNEVIPCQYSTEEDRIGAEMFHEGLAQVYKDGKAYYINRKGDIIFEGTGGRFSEGLALMENGDVVDQNGNKKFAIPDFYINAYLMGNSSASTYANLPYFSDNRIQVVTSDEKEMNKAFNKDGEKLEYIEEGDKVIDDKYNVVVPERNYNEFLTGNDIGLVDKLGNYVIPAKYSEIGRVYPDALPEGAYISNGVALVALRENSCYYFEEETSGINEGMYGSYTPRFYAYADLKGNDTFSKKVLDHIEEANRIGRDRRSKELTRQEAVERTDELINQMMMGTENSTYQGSYQNNSHNNQSKKESTSSVNFYSAYDVIAWLSDKTFYSQGNFLKVTQEGIRFDSNYISGAPTVTDFSGNRAIIKATPIVGGGTITLRLNAGNGTIEQKGETWTLMP